MTDHLTENARLRAARWQPIETAPKGELIDIWLKEGKRWCDCYYDHICDEWRTSRPSGKLVWVKAAQVSHWMPRPSAPTALAAPAPDAVVDWLWYGEDAEGKTHVSLGRWQRHPCQSRYKLADIQPVEHDHPSPAPDAVQEAARVPTAQEIVDAWLDESENFSTRRERMMDYCFRNDTSHNIMMSWLVAAADAALRAIAGDRT